MHSGYGPKVTQWPIIIQVKLYQEIIMRVFGCYFASLLPELYIICADMIFRNCANLRATHVGSLWRHYWHGNCTTGVQMSLIATNALFLVVLKSVGMTRDSHRKNLIIHPHLRSVIYFKWNTYTRSIIHQACCRDLRWIHSVLVSNQDMRQYRPHPIPDRDHSGHSNARIAIVLWSFSLSLSLSLGVGRP